MSLLAHYPLTSNGNNHGLNNYSLAVMGTVNYTAGKLGTAATFTGNPANCLHCPEFNLLDKFTWACWVKVDAKTDNTYQFILSEGRDHDKYGMNLLIVNSDLSLRLLYGTSSTFIIKQLTLGVWYHVAITVDSDDMIKAYINGVFTASKEYQKPDYTYNSERFVIGKMSYLYTGTTNYFPFNGQINDIRVYDHVLSVKEIKELSKGLVIHFPLKSQYEIGMMNKYSGEIAEGNPKSKSSQITITKLSDERGYNYKINYTGTGTSTWINFDFGNFSFTPGKTYFYSCKVRCHSANFNIHLRASRSDNDWVTNMADVINADGQWHEYYAYQTINETYDRKSDETVTCKPELEFYSDNLSTADKVFSANFDIKDIQVVESDCYVPFINNDFTSTIVADCSGYLNNGTASGNLLYNFGSPRYESCYKFSGNSSISSIPQILNSTSTDFTISCWCNFSNNTSTQTVYTSRTGTGQGVALFLIGGKFRLDDGSQAVFSSYSVPANTWLHLCVTRSSTDKKLYINGELISTLTSIGDMSNIGKGSIGGSSVTNGQANSNYTSGLLSDFRLYVTALELSEIQKLYNSPISVDKSGNMYACELKEV